jgi:membrane protease YdiL (CAAX protease family)
VNLLLKIGWGTLQQYGLLAFFYLRLYELLRDERLATFAAAASFAMFHLPNPFLILVTWAAGMLSCWLYRRVRNIWAIGLAHGLLGVALARSLPVEITMGMRIGPGYFRLLEKLQAGQLLSLAP